MGAIVASMLISVCSAILQGKVICKTGTWKDNIHLVAFNTSTTQFKSIIQLESAWIHYYTWNGDEFLEKEREMVLKTHMN